MSEFIPSPQQAQIFDWASHGHGSSIVEAVAGSGKTTTLLHVLKLLRGSVAFAAYNKKIADEIKERMSQMGVGSNVRAGTFHSFGLNAWGRVCKSRPQVDDKKLYLLADRMQAPKEFHKFMADAVSIAKQHALGITTPMEDLDFWNHIVAHFDIEESLTDVTDDKLADAIDLSIKLLKESIKVDETLIDFDDMIYAPLIHGVSVWQNDWVLIDEAQDTNASRRLLASKMLKQDGRLIAVGDRHQAIYGFTGADHDSLDIIAESFGASYLPLTVTYRCPKAVVKFAQQWVNHIEAHPNAPEGLVTTLDDLQFKKMTGEQLGFGNAVLCRNTKPLVELAFNMIKRGIPCHVEGREIGKGLLTLVNKWRVSDLGTLRNRLEQYLEREEERMLARDQQQKAANLRDRVETLFVIMDSIPEDSGVAGLRAHIENLFQDTKDARSRITLSTIHKAKGREWNKVYWYGRNRFQPSPYARQDWQYGQEINLMYVAATRAKQELVEVMVAK